MKLLAAILVLSAGIARTTEPPRPDVPMPCFDKQWFGKHNYLCSLVLKASRNPRLDVYFLGDSITEFWPFDGKEVWKAEFGKLQVLNCGVSGDTTQNILFRITHGELARIAPKVVVVLAGINNLGTYPQLRSDELAGGIRQIVATIRLKSPTSKVVLLSIFPSGEPNDPIRARIVETNKRLAALGDNCSVFFLDIYNSFLDSDGNFPITLSPDGTHPSAKGYQVWADAMRPTLQKLLEMETK